MRSEDIDSIFDPDRAEKLLFGKVLEKPRDRRARLAARRQIGSRRRVEILEAVIPVFAQRGYARATVRRLEAVAPVSRPTMYGYFPSKAQLYAAALRHEAARVEAVLIPAIEGAHANDLTLPAVLEAGRAGRIPDLRASADVTDPPAGTGLDPLARVVHALVRWTRANPDSARLLLQRPIEEDAVVAVHAEIRRAAVAKVEARLRTDRTITARRGLNRRFAVQLHAEMLVGAVEAVLHWALDHPLVPAQHLVRTWSRPPHDHLRRAAVDGRHGVLGRDRSGPGDPGAGRSP